MQLDSGQLSALGAAVERIAPADASGPGAIELGVIDYIEGALADGIGTRTWAEGLAALDACAVARHGQRFDACGPDERDAILTAFEAGTACSGLADEAGFFELLRDHVLQGMFGDPSYGGNRDRGGWRLLSYPGPKLVWTEAEQQVDALPKPAARDDA
jgi:gluconate 2-dehydrogenase gamma chain